MFVFPKAFTEALMTQAMLPAHAAFKRALNEIRNNSNSPRIHDATYELEVLSAAFWPADDVEIASRDRWRGYGLTALECRIMDLFIKNLGKAVSLEVFMNYCYFDRAHGEVPQPKIFAVKVFHLGKKLANSPYRFENVWGKGYRMELKPT